MAFRIAIFLIFVVLFFLNSSQSQSIHFFPFFLLLLDLNFKHFLLKLIKILVRSVTAKFRELFLLGKRRFCFKFSNGLLNSFVFKYFKIFCLEFMSHLKYVSFKVCLICSSWSFNMIFLVSIFYLLSLYSLYPCLL